MRRLPVVQSAAPEDEAAAQRPPWRWWLIGVLANLVFWLPLSLIAAWASVSLAGAAEAAASPLALASALVSYAVACAATGAVLGRFAVTLGRGGAASTAGATAAAAGVLAVGLGVVPLVPAVLAAAALAVSGGLGSLAGLFFGKRRRSRGTGAVDRG